MRIVVRLVIRGDRWARMDSLQEASRAEHEQVAVALRDRVEDTFPRGVDELHLEAGIFCNRLDHVNVKTDDLAFFVLQLKRRIGRIGAHDIHLGRWCRSRSGCTGGGGRRLLLAAGCQDQADQQRAAGFKKLS